MFLEIFWWEKKALEVAGTHFNNWRKLGILDKDLGSSDVISVFTTELQNWARHSFYSAAFCQLVEGLFRLNMAESD